MAIIHAQLVIGWQENLLPEDMPPEWMWPLNEALNEWFDTVKKRHEEKYGTKTDDDDDGDMAQNELTRGKKRR